MKFVDAAELVGMCEFPGYTFTLKDGHGGTYLQVSYMEPDIVTRVPERQFTRKWLISPHMTKSEIVQTAFKCVMTSMEHRAREGFKYRGRRVFGPHFDVDRLWEICRDKNLDYRRE